MDPVSGKDQISKMAEKVYSELSKTPNPKSDISIDIDTSTDMGKVISSFVEAIEKQYIADRGQSTRRVKEDGLRCYG